jgi:hypothetical protein
VVWTLILQSEPEGPTLISCAAKLLKGDLHIQISFSRFRGARSQRILVAVTERSGIDGGAHKESAPCDPLQ